MTRSELDATVVERVIRRYSETLSGEEMTVLARAAHALRNHDALVGALENIETTRAAVFPEDHQYSNADIDKIKNDRDALRMFRFWCEGRIAAALANARKTP